MSRPSPGTRLPVGPRRTGRRDVTELTHLDCRCRRAPCRPEPSALARLIAMENFEERLKRAIQRGTHRAAAQDRVARQQAMSEEELKTLHGKHRLQLCEHIEKCVRQMPQHFPGFRVETLFGERGWGAACSRDDFGQNRGTGRANFFSRLELSVRPYSRLHVLELTAKATVRNKEIFHRTHFQELCDVDPDSFTELVDAWALEFAELYAASSG